jgi:hypothetical protein
MAFSRGELEFRQGAPKCPRIMQPCNCVSEKSRALYVATYPAGVGFNMNDDLLPFVRLIFAGRSSISAIMEHPMVLWILFGRNDGAGEVRIYPHNELSAASQ